MAYKTCECCGEQFEPSTSSQKYCSRECGKRYRYKKNRTKIRASCTTVKGKSLLDWCNENGERGSLLLSEYSSKNELTSEKIPAGSGKRIYWKCSTCGYEWEAMVANRTSCGQGCPSCAGHILETNNLYLWCQENGEYGKKLLDEYSIENEKSPDEVAPKSDYTAKWKCSTCGFEWETQLQYRTRNHNGCPSCAGRILETNNLYLWCMENGERGQRILSEYSSKNELTAKEITPTSNRRVYWKCSTCGYEWIAIVGSRTNLASDCPSCARRAIETNNLYLWCMNNGERGKRLLEEYSPKNSKNPFEIAPKSDDRTLWKCSICEYEWETSASHRTRNHTGCPSCAGKVLGTNNFYIWCQENGEYGERLLEEYSLENKKKPDEVAPKTDYTAKWKCSTCGFEWEAQMQHRTRNHNGCPSCAGRILETNNLYLWCMENGERGQRILREYSLKNELTLEEITPMAHEKVRWKCSICGYEWDAVVASRTSLGCNCPKCDKSQTSYGEQILYYILQRELKEHKVLNRAKVEGYEVDVFVPDLKFGIEYSGYDFHKNRVEQDKKKMDALKGAGYKVIVILERKKNEHEELYCDFSFIRDRILNPEEMLNYLKSYMKENYGLDIDVSLSSDEKEACKRNSAKQYIDIDEVVLLKVCGKSQKESGKRLGVSQHVIGKRLKELSEDELAQKEENIECVYRFTRFGDSAERIASDFELDLDFVKKIQDLIKKYENGYKAPEMEESTLEVEEGDNNNEEESISNFNDDNGDDEFIWL